MSKVSQDIKTLTSKYTNMWWQASTSMPSIASYTSQQQIDKEHEANKILTSISSHLDTVPTDKDSIDVWLAQLKSSILHHAKGNLGMTDSALEQSMLDGFMASADTFIHRTREYDSNITVQDTFQAMRNVWIMNLVQMMSGNEVECTDSVLSYSLLYPYTDNYLDNPEICSDDKVSFNKRLEQRLKGEQVDAIDANEQKVYDMVSNIERQYPRADHPQVYDSILGIHLAQCRSIKHQQGLSSPYEKNILDISSHKGGTSVLADAYLVNGELDDTLSDYMFGFGVVLQLVDDLQDVVEDSDCNSMTIFSQTAKTYPLDNVATKLISFTIDCLSPQRFSIYPQIQDMIVSNSILMVLNAILSNKKHFTKEYILSIQQYFPVSYKYIRKTNKKVSKLRKRMMAAFVHLQ